jgi:4-hydroxybenzoate polyprenyltransferase
VVAGLFAAAVVYGGAFAAEQLSTRHAVAAIMILVFLTGREVLKSVPDTDGDVIAGYRTVATRFGGAAAVGWFRVIAAAHLGIVAAWAPRSAGGAMYVVAVAVFVLPPTAVTLWHLRGRPDAAAVQRGIDRSGLVFAGGLVALLLL